MTAITFAQRSTVVEQGATSTRVLLRLDPPSPSSLLVQLAHSGSAVFGDDWVAPSAIQVPPAKASFPIKVRCSPTFQPPKDAVLQIAAGTGYTIGQTFLHTITRAAASAKPTAENTGPGSAILTPIQGGEIRTAGALIENVLITGGLKIRANGVRIRNFKIDANGADYGIECEYGSTADLSLENGEIFNMASAGVYGRNVFASRLHIHDSGGDAMKLHGNSRVEASYIHMLGKAPGAHADGNQSRTGAHLAFVGCNIDVGIHAQPESNSALLFSTELGPIDDVLVDGCWLNGGNGTVWFEAKTYGRPTRCRLLNSKFGRDFRYFPLLDDGIDTEIRGNVWEDSGELMEINS